MHLDYSMNIGGTCFLQGIYIKFRPKPFHMFNGFLAPRLIWAPLPTLNSTLYLRFSKYLFVEVSALMSPIWSLCLDANNAMRYSIHCAVDTDLKWARKLFFRDTRHFIPSTKFKIGLQYSPLVKLTQSLAKVIHDETVNDGFKIGPMYENMGWCILKQNLL